MTRHFGSRDNSTGIMRDLSNENTKIPDMSQDEKHYKGDHLKSEFNIADKEL